MLNLGFWSVWNFCTLRWYLFGYTLNTTMLFISSLYKALTLSQDLDDMSDQYCPLNYIIVHHRPVVDLLFTSQLNYLHIVITLLTFWRLLFMNISFCDCHHILIILPLSYTGTVIKIIHLLLLHLKIFCKLCFSQCCSMFFILLFTISGIYFKILIYHSN